MFIFINIWNIYIYVTVLKLRKYGIELYTPTKETDTRHQYFWVGQFSYCRSVVRNPSPTCNLQNSKVPCKFSVGFQSIGGLNGGNISYHQISKFPKICHKKTQKIFQQKRGGFRFPPLLPPGNRLVVDLLLAAGTKASLRAAHAAEQGTAPKQAAELAKAPGPGPKKAFIGNLRMTGKHQPAMLGKM